MLVFYFVILVHYQCELLCEYRLRQPDIGGAWVGPVVRLRHACAIICI